MEQRVARRTINNNLDKLLACYSLAAKEEYNSDQYSANYTQPIMHLQSGWLDQSRLEPKLQRTQLFLEELDKAAVTPHIYGDDMCPGPQLLSPHTNKTFIFQDKHDL